MTKRQLYCFLCVAIIIIIIFIYIFSDSKEAFTPGLRRMYRPYVRRGRVYITKLYNTTFSKARVILGKFGII